MLPVINLWVGVVGGPKERERKHVRHSPGVEESGAQDHDGLAGALLQLHLDGAELAVDDPHHALDFFGRDGPRAGLFPQQVHHVSGEFIAGLFK